VPLPFKPSPPDRDASDPLFLFDAEPGAGSALKPPAKTSPENSPPTQTPVVSPELEAMRVRAETAEKLLRDTRRQVAALKREMATFVTPIANKPPRQARWRGVAAALIFFLLLIGAGAAWQYNVPGSPRVAVPPEPVAEAEVISSSPVVASPVNSTVAAPPLIANTIPEPEPVPARASPARAIKTPVNEPREYFGTLSVDAEPAGAEVFINRKSVGKAPARITGLRAGSHLVWIQRAGYRLWTRVVLVPADKVSRVSVALEPDNTVALRP
jgi:hypothetical protein